MHPCVNEVNDDSLAMGEGTTENIFRVLGRNRTHICDDLVHIFVFNSLSFFISFCLSLVALA